MIGKQIGSGFMFARDFLARGLIRVGVSPNAITALGTLFMLGVGLAIFAAMAKDPAWGPASNSRPAFNWFYLLAAGGIILSAACDMLDGAVARLGNMKTDFGAFFDSTLDRFSDFFIWAGIAAGAASHGNLTFTLLAMVAFFNGMMISYSRARAEDIVGKCTVGYWQRGERVAAVLIALFAWNLPALALQQAALPLLTVLRRIGYTRNQILGRSPIVDPRQGGWWLKVRMWRWPRGTWPHDVVTAINILWLIAARLPARDILG